MPVGLAWSAPACSDVFSVSTPPQKVGWFTFAFSKLIQGITQKGVSSTELMVPNDFFVSTDGEVVVGINGDSGAYTRKHAHDEVEYLSGRHHADGKNVFYEEVSSPSDMLSRLAKIRAEAGPIKRLLLLGHGGPGSITLGDSSFSGAWNKSKKGHAILESMGEWLFAPDATIVLLSCATASGYSLAPNYGINSLKEVFTPLLSKRGGKVIASRRDVKIDVENIDDPRAQDIAKNYQNRLDNMSAKETLQLIVATLPLLGIHAVSKGLGLFVKDWKTLFSESIVVIEIPPTPTGPS